MAQNTTLNTFYVRIRSLNRLKKKFAWKTYRFISSCDHDNIETVLLLRYHDIDIDASLQMFLEQQIGILE